MRSGLFAVALAVSLAAAGADLDRGMAAVQRQDWAVARAQFEPLAQQGVAEAQVNLGNLYMKGLGVEQDYKTAFHWYLKAAEQGNGMARDKVGLLHFYGLGVPEDHAEAARWFREAAEQGEAGAAAILGTLHAQGDGVEKSKVRAYFWYTVAADQGNPDARAGRDSLVDEMSPGEINEALDQVAGWRKRHEPAPIPDVEQRLSDQEKPGGAKTAKGTKKQEGHGGHHSR